MKRRLLIYYLFAALAIPLSGSACMASEIEVLVDQLRSILPSEQRKGLETLESNRELILKEAVEKLRRGEISEANIDALLVLASPWQRGLARVRNHKESIRLGNIARPTGREFSIPQRNELVSLLIESLERSPSAASYRADSSKAAHIFRWEVVPKIVALLGELASSEDLDRLSSLLESTEDRYLIDSIASVFETTYALPDLYPVGGICGNSSAEEVERFELSEMKRAKEGRAKVLAWHRKYRDSDFEVRLEAAKKEYWVPLFEDYVFAGRSYYGTIPTWKKLEPLIRQGEAALSVYRKWMEREKDLVLIANYAVIIAAISGEVDRELVRRLLDSEEPGKWEQHAVFACEIILAANSREWKEDLVALQSRPYFDGGRATEFLACCHLQNALPELKAELDRKPKNYRARYAIEELRAWGFDSDSNP